MDYGKSARDVIVAIREVAEPDGRIDWVRAICAVLQLYPFSALAFALHQGDVWPRNTRIQALQEEQTTCGSLYLEDIIDAAETSAAADGAHLVTEVHLARAVSKLGQDLKSLGVSTETLVTRAEERADPPPGVIVPKRPRVIGVARRDLLDAALDGQLLDAVLDREERSRGVERKRSLMNDQLPALAAHEQAAIALVNGNPDTAVYFIFGQEDDLTIVGEVDHQGRPMSPNAVRKCQRRLDAKLQACVPPVSVRWESVSRDGKTVWIACLMGRARGMPHQTSVGSYPYRSGEDTSFAAPDLITAWLRESAADSSDPRADGEDTAQPHITSLTAASAGREDPGAPQRIVLTRLGDAVEAFYANPPEIPHSVQGRSVDDWRAVFAPIVDVFRPVIDDIVDQGIKADVDGLARLGKGIRSIFRLDRSRGGLTWIIEAPRLITRLVADRLLVDAYCSEDWQRLLAVARHPFDSYIGRVPWVLAPEYRHPETLGQDARVAGELEIEEVTNHAKRLKDAGVSDSNLRGACGALNLAFAVCALARQEASGDLNAQWVTPSRELAAEVANWDEQVGLIEAMAALAGEELQVFSVKLPDRAERIEKGTMGHPQFFYTGFGAKAQAAFNRIATEFRSAQ